LILKIDVTFAGTFTNNGGYFSDPAQTFAADIVIGRRRSRKELAALRSAR
jgi:hypothetical protein